MKRRKIILILVLSLLLAAGIAFGIVKWIRYYNQYHINADEWFAAEFFFYQEMTDVAQHVDSTTSLFLNENLDESAYLEQMQVIRQEMNVFLYQHDEKKKLYKVDVNSYTLANKAGIEAAENCYQLLTNLIDDCIANAGDKDRLIYLYLSYKDRVCEEVEIFDACVTKVLLVPNEQGTTEEVVVIQKETTEESE